MVNLATRLVPQLLCAISLIATAAPGCGSDNNASDNRSGSGDVVDIIPDALGDVSGMADTGSTDANSPDSGGPSIDLPPCNTSADCRGGYVCDEQRCREACSESDPCRGVPSICNSESGLCGQCNSDAECTNGRACERGLCDGGCTSDAACGAGNICLDGTCTDTVCEPGTTRCDGVFLLQCDSRGASTERFDCTDQCVDAGFGCSCIQSECAPRSCTPDTGRCVGAGAQTCLPDGSGFDTLVPCLDGQTCIGGQCLSSSCEPGTVSCSGNVIVACSSAGLPEPGTDCSETGALCIESGGRASCQAPFCTPDGRRCLSDTTVGVCDALGASEDEQACGPDQRCQDGVCVDEPTSTCATPRLDCRLVETGRGPDGEPAPLGYVIECDGAAEGGSAVVDQFVYALSAQPAGSAASVRRLRPDLAAVVPDQYGDYTVSLRITDRAGAPGCSVATDSVNVPEPELPAGALRIEVTWRASAPVAGRLSDIDIHLLRDAGAGCWNSTTDDCHWGNREPDWGRLSDPSDDPSLTQDDLDRGGPEVIEFPRPAPGETYTIGVHSYNGNENPTSAVTVTAYIDDEVAYEVTRTMTRWDFWRVASYDASTRTFTEINALQAGTSNRLEPPVPCP